MPEEIQESYEDGRRDGKIITLDAQFRSLEIQVNAGFAALKTDFSAGLIKLGDSIREEVRPVCESVLGNGDPRRGIISRLVVVEEATIFHRWLLYCMVAAIIGGAVKIAWF